MLDKHRLHGLEADYEEYQTIDREIAIRKLELQDAHHEVGEIVGGRSSIISKPQ